MSFEDQQEAMSQVLANAKEKSEKGEALTDVEKVVLSEYVVLCRTRLNELQLKSQRQMLVNEEYLQIQAMESEISKYGKGE